MAKTMHHTTLDQVSKNVHKNAKNLKYMIAYKASNQTILNEILNIEKGLRLLKKEFEL